MSLDLKGHQGFAIASNDHSREANNLSILCNLNRINLIRYNLNIKGHREHILENYIPCGSVECCEHLLGYHVKPNYYPEWLQDSLYRKVWESDEWILGRKLFVKPSDRYKRFTGFCTIGTYKKKKKPPFWYSEIIHFVNEWRYYVTNGKVVASGWYCGDDFLTPAAPQFAIINSLEKMPVDFCGAVDFGWTQYNKFALVEVQHPFACGWYGEQKDDEKYFQWLIDGWIYMKNLKKDI